MNTVVSTVLISAPLAFVAGWVVSKAVVLSGQRGKPATRTKPVKQPQAAGVDDRDAQIAELKQQLDLAEARILKSKRSFRTWRERIRPIVRQFRQQRIIISELRDELRRRSAPVQQTEESAAASRQAKPAAPAKAKAESGAV